MSKYGNKSKERLELAHPDLQKIANDLILLMDVSILCSYRDESEQNAAYSEGKSQLKWPESKHNVSPSMAIDIVPYPVDWNDLERFEQMCVLIESLAHINNVKIRLGRDFSFKDYSHVELIDEEPEMEDGYLGKETSEMEINAILEQIEKDV